MKLKKVNTLKEEKSNNEIAFEEQEKFKKNREDVIKSRTPDKVEKTGDIENAIKNSKDILNTKVPAVKAKKNDFNILESLLKEGFDFDVKSRAFTVNVVDRTSLKKLCECLQKINAKCTINRSVKEGYRYCVTIKETNALKESKALNEAVSEDAYEIAEVMNSNLEKGDKRIYTQDEFEEQFALAIREYFNVDNVWEIANDEGIANLNDKDVDLQEFENDVRGALSTYGWATIYEGDYEGGITNYEEFDEDSYANEIIKIIDDEPWFKERYPDVRDFIFELVVGHNVDDTMTLGEFNDLLNSDFAKEFLGEALNETKEQINESKEDIEAQIKWCETALNNPYGPAAADSKANYGSNWKKEVRADLEKFKKMLADSEKKDESCKVKEAKGIEHNPEEEKKFVGLDESANDYGKEYYEVEEKDFYENMLKNFNWEDEVEYQFPSLTKDDLKRLMKYDLEVIGKMKDGESEEKDILIGGKLEDIINYAGEELGYALHPDFLYHKGEFDRDLLECNEPVKEDICPECGKEPCVCGPATDKDAEYQKTFAKGQAEWDKEVEKELTGKDLDEDLKIITDISEYKPWLGAVDLWDEIVDADKVEELEFALEDLYPDGITLTELNDLLWFEQDFIREQIGLAKAEEDDDTVEESFEEKKQRIKESFDK